MRALFYAATFAILASTPVFGAGSVSLVGTWTGQRDRIAKVEGRRGGLATLVITEQQGNTFVGRLKRSNASGDEEEPLWGAFHAGRQVDHGIGRERNLHLQSRQSEYARLLLQRDGRFTALRVRKAHAPALAPLRTIRYFISDRGSCSGFHAARFRRLPERCLGGRPLGRPAASGAIHLVGGVLCELDDQTVAAQP
jgi:hypothetical protein